MTAPMPGKRGSLLERAAEVYDFQAHLRARDVPAVDEAAIAGEMVADERDSARPPAAADPEPVEGRPVAIGPVAESAPTNFAPIEDLSETAGEPIELAPPSHPGEGQGPVAIGPMLDPGFHRNTERGETPASVAIDRALMAENGLLIPGAPVGVLAEEFRLAKRQLLLTMRQLIAAEPEKARTILVCSPKPGDGKTYCAINLAISLAAERDTRVLLVDADFAKPGVMARLGVAAEGPGFLDVLADSDLAIEDCVIATDIPQLSLLPAGARTNADTELAASERTAELIAELLDADPHRIVIFDSPPALAASPASVLALHVGQVMLVVRADRTTEGDIRDSVQRLDGCEDIQLLLNGVAFSADGYRFGNYYGQGDGQ